MRKFKSLLAYKHIIWIGLAASLIFLSAAMVVGIRFSDQMKSIVQRQFNQEQLVIAQNVARLIEKELDFLKKEISLLGRAISNESMHAEDEALTIRNSFARVRENGVWKIEIVDLKKKKRSAYLPYGKLPATKAVPAKTKNLLPFEGWVQEKVWISVPQVKTTGINLVLAFSAEGKSSEMVLFQINVSWLLTPLLKDLRSGKTGYAWLIDEKGVFLFHPMAEFTGQNAFKIRDKKDPRISYGIINFIQKEKMLKGLQGTGWYYSGWHRGVTDKIKKLIAYCPVRISENPDQRWSVALVAPMSEIEADIKRVYQKQFLMQGMILAGILLGAMALLFYERRWLSLLEGLVHKRTAELKRSEMKYRSLIESAEDFIFSVDLDGNLQSLNSFTADFFGGQLADFIGKPLSTLFPQKVAEKQLMLVRLVGEHGKSLRDEFQIQINDHITWISANFMPLKDDAGKVASILCIARDITESKNLETQLVNAEKLASLGTLAAGIAHEVNNPLSVMLGFCDILRRKTTKETQDYEDLLTIERQGLHCKEIVENLLSFVRIGENSFENADINVCIADILKVVQHTLEMNDIELETYLAENLPPVKGDPRELQQVFLNIINNAVAAMQNGGKLTISTNPDRKNRKIVIRFEDTGLGINKEDMDHIFEPFFTTKPEGKGTGLGLFVSYGIISKYGGTIACVSNLAHRPGEKSGTTFIIRLLIKK